jgi:hypothetical protein
MPDDLRLRALMEAESKAMALLDAIEDCGLIGPGRSEAMVVFADIPHRGIVGRDP